MMESPCSLKLSLSETKCQTSMPVDWATQCLQTHLIRGSLCPARIFGPLCTIQKALKAPLVLTTTLLLYEARVRHACCPSHHRAPGIDENASIRTYVLKFTVFTAESKTNFSSLGIFFTARALRWMLQWVHCTSGSIRFHLYSWW